VLHEGVLQPSTGLAETRQARPDPEKHLDDFDKSSHEPHRNVLWNVTLLQVLSKQDI
jgi:hypothetical protein